MANPLGRPSEYTEEVAEAICAALRQGMTAHQAAEMAGTTKTTLYNWINKYPAFLDQYMRARESAAHANADDVQELARRVTLGELPPDAARVAIDALKWTAGKRKPKVYGDKLETESTVTHKWDGMKDRLALKIHRVIDATSEGSADSKPD